MSRRMTSDHCLPSVGRIVFDGKRYMVTDSTDEGGVYTITMEANRTK